jgi:tetratricopeptide (TPR) repeat protein
MAARTAGSDTLPTILHRLAWCFYRERDFDNAVETMKKAVDVATKSGEKFLNLREEALRDMAIFMTEIGRVDDAIEYFKKVAGDKSYFPKLLEKLGREYERNVEPAKATMVYDALLKTRPDDDTRFRVMVKLIDLDLRRGHFKEAIQRVKQVTEPNSSDNETQVAQQNLRAMVRRTATENHEKYRKNTDNRASLETAEAFYETYLNQFLKRNDPRKEIPEIQMYLAEVKRDLGKAREASDLYRQVIDSHDVRYAKEAGALWTASLSDAIRKASVGQPKTMGAKSSEPSALEKEYIEAADRLQDALGDTTDGREAALKAAEVEAGYKPTQSSAVKRLKNIIKKNPKSPQALTAARLWVQIFADRLVTDPDSASDLKEAIADIRENSDLMANDQSSGQGKLRALMAEQETRLKVSAIARNEKDKDFQAAAKGYESFARDSSSKDLAEKAYANAITNYLKASDAASVDRVSDEWLKRFPGSTKAADSIRSVGTQLLIQGQFDAAARQFYKVGLSGNDPSALQTGGRIYQGVGSYDSAQLCWKTFLDKYPKSALRARVVLELAKSYEGQRDDSSAAKYYKTCLEMPGFEAECGARLADLHMKGEDVEGAHAMYKKVASMSGKKHESLSPYVGYARFVLASKMEKDAHFDPLELPDTRLKKSLQQRTSFLEPLSRAYMSAVEAGGPWAIAALGNLAAWADRFADEVDRISPPDGSKPESVEKFKKSLKALSDPLRKKAVVTWSEAYNKAQSAEAFSPALPEIADHLADERASSPLRAQGVRGKFRLFGMPADGGAAGKTAAFAQIREKLSKNTSDANNWIDYGNLLWGSGTPMLARIAYEYALTIAPNSAGATSNEGVLVASDGEEDWANAYDAAQYFREALKKDEFFLPAKMNMALLMNYYRLFSKSKPLWDQVRARAQGQAVTDINDGYAISSQGLGDLTSAEMEFNRASEGGANPNRFAEIFHRAARQSFDRVEPGLAGEKCLGTLNGLGENGLNGFEKTAFESLKRACTLWQAKQTQ